MPSVSKRGQAVPHSPFRKLAPLADQAKARGVKVYHLNIGQPDIFTPQAAMAALKKVEMDILAYTPAAGNLSYRRKLTEYYARFDIAVKPEDIVVAVGASEAIQLALLAGLNPGDEVIIPEPFYANYNGFAQIADVVIKPISCRIEDGFALPGIEDFERQITSRTRAILITNPNNPTGCLYGKEVLQELGALAKQHDLYLMGDEVYREFCFDGQVFHSLLNLKGLEDHVVVFDSVSKRYSACGARVGAVVSRNAQLLESINRYATLRLSPPGLGQILAEYMVDAEENYLTEVAAEYDHRRKTVYNRLREMPGVECYLPGGAFYSFARFPIEDSEHFCRWLLTDFQYNGATLMLSPGRGFYATPDIGVDEVRMAYVLNCHDLNAAMDCLEAALDVYPGVIPARRIRKVAAV